MKIELKGVIPPIVTPTNDDETLNTTAFKNVIDYVIEGGVHGIFVMGSNGEFYAFDESAQKNIVQKAVEYANGRVAVYAGASAITTKSCIRLAKNAQEVGADAVTVLAPTFITVNDDELYEHYKKIAQSVSLPVLLYNNPGKTANNISTDLLSKLSRIENIVGIKNTSLDFSQTIKYIEAITDNESFNVFSGTDFYILATMMHGGVGCVAGTANIAPKLVVKIYDRFLAGDMQGALDAQRRLLPLRNAYGYGSFPVVMKECFNIMGIDVGMPVAPIKSCTPTNIKKISKILKDLELI